MRHNQHHILCVEGIISLEIKRPGPESENTYLPPKFKNEWSNACNPPTPSWNELEQIYPSSIRSKMGTVLQHNVATAVESDVCMTVHH